KIIDRIKAPASKKPPVLNDVAVSEQGELYVSGSASRKIYKLENDRLVTFISDEERLRKANGLLVDGNYLIHGGQFWNRYSTSTGALIDKVDKPAPDSQLYDFDGITHDGYGGYLVTLINDSRLWHIPTSGRSKPVSEDKIQGIDIHYDGKTKRLFVPQVGGGLTVYRID
ncbi:MAG: hypothetical protein OQJ89_01690, partial [Kangiellaceae bacterium]|nr:hypothetical protein [Kangiellaceae bacterium]